MIKNFLQVFGISITKSRQRERERKRESYKDLLYLFEFSSVFPAESKIFIFKSPISSKHSNEKFFALKSQKYVCT